MNKPAKKKKITKRERIARDRRKMTIVGAAVGLPMLLAVHFAVFGPERPAEPVANAGETREILTFVRPQEGAVEERRSSDVLPVTYDRRMPRINGEQLVDASGRFIPELVHVAVLDQEGNIEYVRGNTPRGWDALTSNGEEDPASQELISNTRQVHSPVPSDNQEPSRVEVPLPGTKH